MEANKFIEQLEHKILGTGTRIKKKLKKALEENQTGALILETIKEEAKAINEE
jgi:hypothetical protein